MRLRTSLLGTVVILAIWHGAIAQFRVTGSISDASTGLPLHDAEAMVVSVIGPTMGPLEVTSPVSAMTNEAGNFLFNSDYLATFRSKEVLLFAWAEKYGFKVLRLSLEALPGNYDFSLELLVPLTGSVRTDEGVPVSGALVGVVYADEIFEGITIGLPAHYQGVLTDGGGQYTTWVSPGYVHTVEVFHEDFLPSYSPLLIVQSPEDAFAPIPLVVEPGLIVAGKLVDEAGRSLSGQTLRLISKGRQPPYPQSRAFVRKLHQIVTTGSDGGFIFRGVIPGDKELIVDQPNGTLSSRRDLSFSASQTDLVVSQFEQ